MYERIEILTTTVVIFINVIVVKKCRTLICYAHQIPIAVFVLPTYLLFIVLVRCKGGLTSPNIAIFTKQ